MQSGHQHWAYIALTDRLTRKVSLALNLVLALDQPTKFITDGSNSMSAMDNEIFQVMLGAF
jgi:hypothetical protein